MNGNSFLADTNTFISLLNKKPSVQSFLESDWSFSFITEIELLGKPGIKSDEVKNIRTLLNICQKLVHVEPVNHLTITLKQQYKIKLPDAIIAATAIHYHLPLLTFDKAFQKLDFWMLFCFSKTQRLIYLEFGVK
jgi:predicted nucleic acid-binding protein